MHSLFGSLSYCNRFSSYDCVDRQYVLVLFMYCSSARGATRQAEGLLDRQEHHDHVLTNVADKSVIVTTQCFSIVERRLWEDAVKIRYPIVREVQMG